MDTPIAGSSARASTATRWFGRSRLLLGVLVAWAPLYYGIGRGLMRHGFEHPVVVTGGEGGLVAAAAFAVVMLLGGVLGSFIAGRADGRGAVLVASAALLAWTFAGGTMDDWLLSQQPAGGPGSAAPYRALIGELVYLTVVLGGLVALVTWLRRRDASPVPGGFADLWAEPQNASSVRNGALALLVTIVVAAFLLSVLNGPAIAITRRGQVIFATAVSFWAATLAAHYLTHVRRPLWYWAAVPVVGLIGLLYAQARPVLGAPYENINTIPPLGLARPLPVELLSVGFLAIHWAFRTIRLARDTISRESSA